MKFLLILMSMKMVHGYVNETATGQLLEFKGKNPYPVGVLTTSFGSPVERRDTVSLSATSLINNEYLMESLTELDREIIPERIVHAKGGLAFGYFEVTRDITDICKADMFSGLGKKTPVAVRFSNVMPESGGADTIREPRGMALKFYTLEGNFDLVNLNVEMFLMKDPTLFTAFIHSFKRNPRSHVIDVNARWDFLTSNPDSLHMMMRVFGDRGISNGFRYLPSFTIHTYQIYNNKGESYFTRIHILPDAGIKNLTSAEGTRLAGEDPDYAIRDLYNAIGRGHYPTWTFYLQVATLHDAQNAKHDLFDITRTWDLEKYPLREIGRIVLDTNPTNYFAQVEQIGFNPGNLIPGILGGVDKIFEARRFSYRDALVYRLGKNYNKIEVNCPYRAKTLSYYRDGVPPTRDNFDGLPNYYPNSFSGPVPYLDKNRPSLLEVATDSRPNNFDQSRRLYISMSEGEKTRLVQNINATLSNAADFLQVRAVKLYTYIHEDLGRRISTALGSNIYDITIMKQ